LFKIHQDRGEKHPVNGKNLGREFGNLNNFKPTRSNQIRISMNPEETKKGGYLRKLIIISPE